MSFRRTASCSVVLRPVEDGDLATFFEQQRDPGAVRMAGFTARDPSDREAFMAHWARIRADEAVTVRAILLEGRVAGHVSSFERQGVGEVTYWIGRRDWGRGVATAALSALLAEVTVRPIHARAAADNAASIRVLEKCGFAIRATGRAFAAGRGEEIEEVLMELRA